MADERVPERAAADQQPQPARHPRAPAPNRVTITRTVKVKPGLTQVIGVLIVGASVIALLVGLLAAALMPPDPTAVASGARGRLYLLMFAPGGIGVLIGVLLASRPTRPRRTEAASGGEGPGAPPS